MEQTSIISALHPPYDLHGQKVILTRNLVLSKKYNSSSEFYILKAWECSLYKQQHQLIQFQFLLEAPNLYSYHFSILVLFGWTCPAGWMSGGQPACLVPYFVYAIEKRSHFLLLLVSNYSIPVSIALKIETEPAWNQYIYPYKIFCGRTHDQHGAWQAGRAVVLIKIDHLSYNPSMYHQIYFVLFFLQ